ncbi:MAG: hypothetical protein P0Y65_16465 [Candidatus Devosia phytovorans]|uniref:Uncharacterized protein n=1 Tax=Candidatus Devosia phytovorans TaxID=3121372 RepID=A0AAJ6AYN0_9HYPH|nr:hypothetical protein [Devosia sp.]WEK03770.1 MAG: hypothetical protein P0Y65_16465 [Devosia sp.]
MRATAVDRRLGELGVEEAKNAGSMAHARADLTLGRGIVVGGELVRDSKAA